MFWIIFRKEFKRLLFSLPFLIFWCLFVLITYMTVSNMNPGTIIMGISYGKEMHNAPLVIARIFSILTVTGLLFSLILIGRSVNRDFDARIHDFFFTIPMSRLDYLGGRFCGGLAANLALFTAVIAGVILGCLPLEAKYCAPFSFSAFLLPILILVLPNLLLIGGIFFSLAVLSRKMILTYVSGVLFLMIYVFVLGGFARSESDLLRILGDPFGVMTLTELTKFWTVAEINTNRMPLAGLLFVNRIIWLGVASGFLLFAFRRFEFVTDLETRKRKSSTPGEAVPESRRVRSLGDIEDSILEYSFTAQLAKMFRNVSIEFRRIVFHPAFLILTFMAITEILANFIGNIGQTGNNEYPLTAWYLSHADHVWAYMIPVTILFGGLIVWRERDNGSSGFFDTVPVPDWLSCLSKLLTLMSIQTFYVVLVILAGICTQVFYFGFFDIQPDLYIKKMFGIELIKYWHMAILVLFIQNLVPNRYLGFFLCALYYVADLLIFGVFKYENILMRYGAVPKYIFTNMNGYGPYAETIFWYTVHWAMLGLILVYISSMLWRRSDETHLKYRIRGAIKNLSSHRAASLLVLTILFVVSGGFIGYNKYFLNDYLSKRSGRAQRAAYETKYGKFAHFPGPSITGVDLKIDFFPGEREIDIRGSYILKNKTAGVIDTIFISLSERELARINRLEFTPRADLTFKGKEYGFRCFEPENPLLPGEEIKLEFDFEVAPRGFSENNPVVEAARNGSSLLLSAGTPKFFPAIGYCEHVELTKKHERKKLGLPEKALNPTLEESDPSECFWPSDRARLNVVLGTCESQVAVSNGRLLDRWTENGRNYFHYGSDIPMANEFVFVSAEYEIAREEYKGINIEVYYDKKHGYNIRRIIEGVKASLDYSVSNYCPFPYKDVKIVEITDYMSGGLARSQPTIFSWREDGGFLSQIDNTEDVDMVFGICTHEMAHQWWGYIVMPARSEGAFMLTETMAQYVEIMCLEDEYGRKMADKERRREMKEYLKRRKSDREGERPLMRASEKQHYINYPKSTIVMYALQDYLGEDRVSLALRGITDDFGHREDLFARSSDVVRAFENIAPDSLRYLVSDLFEYITLYENRADEATFEREKNGKYKVFLSVSSKKFHADSLGVQVEVPLNDYIEVGVLGEDEEELYMRKRRFTKEKMEFEIEVEKRPVKAGIDPRLILIDREQNDNLVKVKES